MRIEPITPGRPSTFDNVMLGLEMNTRYFTDSSSRCAECGSPAHHYENESKESYYFLHCEKCIDKANKKKYGNVKLRNRIKEQQVKKVRLLM